MRARGDVRPTDTYWLAVQVNEIDQVEEVRLLVEHTTNHDEIGPVEVGVRQRLGVAIKETDIPMLGQHGGDGDQPEWRRRILRADEFTSFRIVPKRVRNKLWIDHQNAAGTQHGTLVHGGRVSRSWSRLKRVNLANKARPTVTNSTGNPRRKSRTDVVIPCFRMRRPDVQAANSNRRVAAMLPKNAVAGDRSGSSITSTQGRW